VLLYLLNLYSARLQTLTKCTITQGGQEGTHTILRGRLRLAFHHSRWAGLTRAGGRRRADCRSRTFDFGASGSRARRAFSRGLIALGAIQDDRLGLRNRGLQNIVAQIGNRRHLRFQNILT